MLQAHDQVYDGVPLKCENHLDRMVIMQSPEKFEKKCPDRGYSDPWYINIQSKYIAPMADSNGDNSSTLLPYQIHICIRQCHRVQDHKRMKYTMTIHKTCPKNHNYFWQCFRGEPKVCPTCFKETIKAEQKRNKDAKLEKKRRKTQLEYAK
ncbi:uncharacterized protein BO88DRAFT_419860 [Aspergillus vadensis CBS 113365]|uniref:Uncharacterized protein n=1 Tax=Aspergillus vadensis (strain CBS 113365 / IMI 142717 / IBT 24658) TaxID=1448311 RepID=A0A319B1F4_ASPVC|nr:hypothetical protein BO88DRAFT_419860 [Aspergillus vadensis CBS 113365]PYH63990.1 hypothetical protein BO88DRAFT_419860 [Aspergillus vadensis CBS 113365]